MKGFGKIVASIFAISLFFVLYVHEQVLLLRVSYAIESKSDKAEALSEEYRQLRFEVDQLKAPRLLENKMNQMEMKLTLPDEIRVIKTPIANPVLPTVREVPVHATLSARFANILGRWIDVAQAKTDN